MIVITYYVLALMPKKERTTNNTVVTAIHFCCSKIHIVSISFRFVQYCFSTNPKQHEQWWACTLSTIKPCIFIIELGILYFTDYWSSQCVWCTYIEFALFPHENMHTVYQTTLSLYEWWGFQELSKKKNCTNQYKSLNEPKFKVLFLFFPI